MVVTEHDIFMKFVAVLKGRRKVWKSSIIVVGMISPSLIEWDRVNLSYKIWGGRGWDRYPPPLFPTALLNSPDANHNIFPLPQLLFINHQVDQFIWKVFIFWNKRFFDFIQFRLKLFFQKCDFSNVLMANIL